MRALPRAAFARNTAARSFDALGYQGLSQLCLDCSSQFAPFGELGHEHRDGFPIVYSESRAKRHSIPPDVCVVCDSQTCPAVDVAELPGEDLAWFTPNLYPITLPAQMGGSQGLHLVHWSSLHHEAGLRGASPDVAIRLLQHLAHAEQFLLHHAPERFPDRGDGHRGHVGIVKNRGRRVGGSVEHDHQQILLSAALPSEPQRTGRLAAQLLRDTPTDLLVEQVHGEASILMPSFMRRPLHCFVVPHGTQEGWLHHMPTVALEASAVALARLTAAMDCLMTSACGEPAWNLILHTGPETLPLFELRPFTQPLGGYEHMGLYLCEERPQTSAARLREALEDLH